jgi:hypothetical protein
MIQVAQEVEVRLDGVSLGRSDSFRTDVAPGSHRLEFSAEGLFIPAQRIYVRAGQAQMVTIEDFAGVRLVGRPDNCEVWVDGINIGVCPTTFRAPVGGYQLEFRWPGGRIKRYPLDLRGGMTPVVVSP